MTTLLVHLCFPVLLVMSLDRYEYLLKRFFVFDFVFYVLVNLTGYSSVHLGSSILFPPAVEISFRSSNLSPIWNCCTACGISFLNRPSSGKVHLPSALAVWLEMPNRDNCRKPTDWSSSFCGNVWLLIFLILADSFGVGLAQKVLKCLLTLHLQYLLCIHSNHWNKTFFHIPRQLLKQHFPTKCSKLELVANVFSGEINCFCLLRVGWWSPSQLLVVNKVF